jgi:gluconate kinase
LKSFETHFVLLLPPLQIAKNRNKLRKSWTVPDEVIESVYNLLEVENSEENGWLIIDNSDLTIKQTVEKILKSLNSTT